jgi:hypothetical protein
MTYAFAELEISQTCFDYIARKLRAAGYDHVFVEGGLMDMHGVALRRAADRPRPTVEELEAILNSKDDRPVVINADGSITVD